MTKAKEQRRRVKIFNLRDRFYTAITNIKNNAGINTNPHCLTRLKKSPHLKSLAFYKKFKNFSQEELELELLRIGKETYRRRFIKELYNNTDRKYIKSAKFITIQLTKLYQLIDDPKHNWLIE